MVLEVEGDVIVFLYILHGVFERVCADTRMAMQISTCRGFFFIIGWKPIYKVSLLYLP